MDKIKEYNSLCDIQVSGHTLRASVRTSLHRSITGGDDATHTPPVIHNSTRAGGMENVITLDKKTVVIA